jgi:25S rRNA (uracil2634-N3)-methyltransferase
MKRSRPEQQDSSEEGSAVHQVSASPLLVHEETLQCMEAGCIPCLYKIFPSGSHLDQKLPPNTRPEMCPRSRQSTSSWGYYKASHNILTLGDGDLSFSCSLMNLVQTKQNNPRNLDCHLFATTHEPRDRLLRVYPQFQTILGELARGGAHARHEVDATVLEPSFPRAEYQHFFDFIIWNFPCIRMPRGADGQVEELEANKSLLKHFFGNCAYLLKEQSVSCKGGEVHVTHKTIEPFSWWRIESIAEECGLRCVGRVVFDKYLYPGYVNKKVLDNKSFPLHDARVSRRTTILLNIVTLYCF